MNDAVGVGTWHLQLYEDAVGLNEANEKRLFMGILDESALSLESTEVVEASSVNYTTIVFTRERMPE
jgi:hypothetical protein